MSWCQKRPRELLRTTFFLPNPNNELFFFCTFISEISAKLSESLKHHPTSHTSVNTIKIIGTSHISAQSAREIEKAFNDFQPDIIAVELDPRRLKSLLSLRKGDRQRLPVNLIGEIGLFGYLFLVIGSYVQRKLAGIVKVQPGVDMLRAVELAKEHNKLLLLADQDIMITTRKLSREFPAREKWRMVWDVITGPFQREKLDFKLERVPSKATVKKLMHIMKDRYPTLYRILVVDRNVVMAVKLDRLLRENPSKRVLLVVGAGHEEDLRERLARSEQYEFA